MTGIVVGNTVRSAWKQILYWSVGLGLLGFYIVFIGSDTDIVEGYAGLFEAMPPALLEAFGASGLEILSTSEGWIVSILVSEAGLFLSAFAVIAGLNVSANDEQSGVMDVILSLPISRGAYLLERWLGYALIGLAIHVCLALIVVLSVVMVGSDADNVAVFGSILNLFPWHAAGDDGDEFVGRRLAAARGRDRLVGRLRSRQLRLRHYRRHGERLRVRLDAGIVLFQLRAGRRDRHGRL